MSGACTVSSFGTRVQRHFAAFYKWTPALSSQSERARLLGLIHCAVVNVQDIHKLIDCSLEPFGDVGAFEDEFIAISDAIVLDESCE